MAVLTTCLPAGCVWFNPIDASLPAEVRRPQRAAVIFFADGMDHDTVQRLLDGGRLPNIRKYLIDRGVRVADAVTVIPSITFAANVSFATGLLPGHHGVTGNRWFDRHTLRAESYIGIIDYQRVDAEFAARTIYQAAPDLYSAVILSPVGRGATRHFRNWLSTGVTWFFGTMEQVDALTAYRLGEVAAEARRIGRWPDLIHAYFCGPDHVGHVHGKASPQYESALANIDGQIGRFARALEQAGMLDRTLLALVTDHGHVVVRPGQHVNLPATLNGRFGLSATDRATPDNSIYWQRHKVFADRRVVVCADGNRRAVLHLRVGDEWRNRPTLDQIARFHRDYGGRAVGGNPAPFWQVLLEAIKPAGELAAVRDGPDRVLVTDGAGVGLVERQAAATQPAPDSPSDKSYRYSVRQPPDPLALADADGAELLDGHFHSSQAWLQATCRARFPDFVAQIVEYFDSPRAGDLLLFCAEGWDFSATNLGSHGGAGRQDMRVPMIFAGPGVRAGGTIPTARAVDLAPTVLDFLGRPDAIKVLGPIDGVSRWNQLAAPATVGESR